VHEVVRRVRSHAQQCDAQHLVRARARRDVPAAAELEVELWDVGGAPTRSKKLREQQDPGRMLAAARFLGRVEVPLSDTVTLRCGAAAA